MGKVIHEMANELGLKAEDIAPHLKRTVGTVYSIYNRKDVDTGTLFTLSRVFKKPIAAFFGDEYEQVIVKEVTAEYGPEDVRELQHENEKLRLIISHKDELLSVYKERAGI